METVIEILLEFFAQMVLEILAELGLRSIKEPFRRQPRPAYAVAGYILFGGIVGLVSVWLLPQHLIAHEHLRLANLILSPLVAGLVMMLLGHWRRQRRQPLIRLDRFGYGFLFALSIAVVRYLLAA